MFASPLLVPAQVASSSSAPSVVREDPITLSPFTVNPDADVGYQAGNTLAGSRMNTSLKDTAASISVMTEEFIKDIGALDLTAALTFGNNVQLEVKDGNLNFEFFNTFQVRGQTSTVARNYFRWRLPTDIFNVERIEESRGPNSILFGIASAGGILSTSTKQAFTGRTFRRGTLAIGDENLRRVTFDINQSSFNDRLGIRFNAVGSEGAGRRPTRLPAAGSTRRCATRRRQSPS